MSRYCHWCQAGITSVPKYLDDKCFHEFCLELYKLRLEEAKKRLINQRDFPWRFLYWD